MTRVRRLALWIAENVRTYASQGCVEWAEALEAEIAVIESDWTALWWALGSLRVLLVYREKPWRTVAEVEEEAEKHAEIRRNARLSRCVYPLLLLCRPALIYTSAHSAMQRTGCVFEVMGWTLAAASSFLLWLRRLEVPEPWDEEGLIEFLKKELKRRASVNSVAGYWWIGVVCCGVVMEKGYGAHRVAGACAVMVLCEAMWSWHAAGVSRRRLRQVEELMSRCERRESQIPRGGRGW